MIRIVFMDIDGTLIPYGQESVDPAVMEAIRLLQKQGILVFGVTGRSASQVPWLGFDGTISYDGACVQDKGKTVIREEFFEKGELDLIASRARQAGHRVIISGKSSDPVGEQMEQEPERVLRVKRPWLLEDQTRVQELRTALEQSCFDKGLVMTRILSILQIPASQAMALGDGFNDMGMLAGAGLSAAMKEAPIQVQACADFTADGTLDALRRARLTW